MLITQPAACPGHSCADNRAAERLGSAHMIREWLQLLSVRSCHQSPRDTQIKTACSRRSYAASKEAKTCANRGEMQR